MNLLAGERTDDGYADEVLNLLIEQSLEVLVALAVCQLGGQAHELACDRAIAVVHGVFHGSSQVDVAGRCPFTNFAEVWHYAAAVAPVTCVFRRQSCGHQHFGTCCVVMYGREACAAADKLADCQQKFGWAVGMDAHA